MHRKEEKENAENQFEITEKEESSISLNRYERTTIKNKSFQLTKVIRIRQYSDRLRTDSLSYEMARM